MKAKSTCVYFIHALSQNRFNRVNMASTSLILLFVFNTYAFAESVAGRLVKQKLVAISVVTLF